MNIQGFISNPKERQYRLDLLQKAVAQRDNPQPITNISAYEQSSQEYIMWNKIAPTPIFHYKATLQDILKAEKWGKDIVQIKDDKRSKDSKRGQSSAHRPNRYKNWATGKLGEVAAAYYLDIPPKWDFTAVLGHKYDTDIMYDDLHIHVKTRRTEMTGWVVDPLDTLFTKTKSNDVLMLVDLTPNNDLYVRGIWYLDKVKDYWEDTTTIKGKKAIRQSFVLEVQKEI